MTQSSPNYYVPRARWNERLSDPRASRRPSPVLVCPTLHFPGRRVVMCLCVCERRALFGRRRSGSSGNGTGSSRRSSRGCQPTQESILGPISITIYISMNNGDSDAMDKAREPRRCSFSRFFQRQPIGFSRRGTDHQAEIQPSWHPHPANIPLTEYRECLAPSTRNATWGR